MSTQSYKKPLWPQVYAWACSAVALFVVVAVCTTLKWSISVDAGRGGGWETFADWVTIWGPAALALMWALAGRYRSVGVMLAAYALVLRYSDFRLQEPYYRYRWWAFGVIALCLAIACLVAFIRYYKAKKASRQPALVATPVAPTSSKQCRHCGTRAADDAAFCSSCGIQL